MIKSFACKHTHLLYQGYCPPRFAAIRQQAERKLQMLESALSIEFLRSPPGNRLEALRGGRAGQYSIRINDQWRLCFRFEQDHCHDVEIVDYH